jgi:hypothetical protein
MQGGGMHTWEECDVSGTLSSLIMCADAAGVYSKVVDIFDATTGNWSTAVLSEARYYLAATSLPNQGLAIFAGGGGTSCD